MLNGPALKKYRKTKGLKQTDLAKIIGVHPIQISAYENGKTNPKPETITALAKALDVPVSKITTNLW